MYLYLPVLAVMSVFGILSTPCSKILWARQRTDQSIGTDLSLDGHFGPSWPGCEVEMVERTLSTYYSELWPLFNLLTTCADILVHFSSPMEFKLSYFMIVLVDFAKNFGCWRVWSTLTIFWADNLRNWGNRLRCFFGSVRLLLLMIFASRNHESSDYRYF